MTSLLCQVAWDAQTTLPALRLPCFTRQCWARGRAAASAPKIWRMKLAELTAEHCLLLYVLMVVSHIVVILASRSWAIASGNKKPNDFDKSRNMTEDTFIGRVAASHANCLENLPLLAVVVLTNSAVHGPDISFLAGCYLTARLIQICFHTCGVTDELITLRFYAFVTQLALLVTMGLKTFFAIKRDS